MTIVAGVDFGTQSVRVALVDSTRGPLGAGVAEYPVRRDARDPDFATQSHHDHMEALVTASARALTAAGVSGTAVEALALDTTGSTVVMVGEGLKPLDDYYLWCDHRAKREAARITDVARERGLPALERCGGVYSSEWGFAKLLHWLRNHPERRAEFVTALEHCDLVAAVLCGITDPAQVPRSICAAGHKWLWYPDDGGLPSEEFLVAVDPLLAGIRARLESPFHTSREIAGALTEEWAARLGFRTGIPIPVGAFDAHWDAVGAGIREGDVVNVIGTATCVMAIARDAECVPGVCGVVEGSIDPDLTGVEAGLSGCGYIFEALAARHNTTLPQLTADLANHRAGQTGLLHLTWDNGDRTVLVNADLGGVTLGWNLNHTAADALFAAIEGTAMHTRIILDRMREHGVPIRRVIHGGGIPQKNPVLNQVYANVLGMPVLVPKSSVTSLGSAIFAFLAAGTFSSIVAAQDALCPEYHVIEPDSAAHAVYQELYPLFRQLYFGLGVPGSTPLSLGGVLPTLRTIAARQRR